MPTQVPLEQVPQAPQAVLQHTPLTQLPDVHWLAAVQEAPFDCGGVHTPKTHTSPEMQLVSALQVVRQAFGPQTYGEHLWVVSGGQLPVPLHWAELVWVPFEQLAARHTAPFG